MSKRKGIVEAKCMMMRAGLTVEVINRVFLLDSSENKIIRKTDNLNKSLSKFN